MHDGGILRARTCSTSRRRLAGSVWDEHELNHHVFEHGVSQGLRLAECHLGHGRVRAVDRQGGDVVDLPRLAAQRGWDEHELMYLVVGSEDFPGPGNQAKVWCVDDPSSDSLCPSRATWARQ